MVVDFHSLFERHSQDVYRFAVYLSGDPSLAEEITQETFVRAWVMPGEVCGGTAKAYLLAIARNLYCAERMSHERDSRSHQRPVAPLCYASGEAGADTRALVDEFLRQDPEFAELLQGRGEEGLLHLAVPRLPPDREAQALRR